MWFPGIEVSGGYEPQCECWETNLDPLQEQRVHLTAEPSLCFLLAKIKEHYQIICMLKWSQNRLRYHNLGSLYILLNYMCGERKENVTIMITNKNLLSLMVVRQGFNSWAISPFNNKWKKMQRCRCRVVCCGSSLTPDRQPENLHKTNIVPLKAGGLGSLWGLWQ